MLTSKFWTFFHKYYPLRKGSQYGCLFTYFREIHTYTKEEFEGYLDKKVRQ